jgi:hypothetical protein
MWHPAVTHRLRTHSSPNPSPRRADRLSRRSVDIEQLHNTQLLSFHISFRCPHPRRIQSIPGRPDNHSLRAAAMSRPTSVRPSSAPTPVPSSPPPSESYLSELDGTAPSVLDTSVDFAWDAGAADASVLNLVSWKLDVNARAEDGVDRRGFNGESSSGSIPRN